MMQKSDPVSIWTLGALLGEGPVWVGRDDALWFTDIKGCTIHRLDPATGGKASWKAPGQCGFALPIASGGFVAGLKQGLHRFDEQSGSFTPILDPEPALPNNRLNDGVVDPHGQLWFGTMDDDEASATGMIYRLGSNGSAEAMSPPCTVTNGPAFSPDGRTLYHTDTLGGVIYACTLASDGSIAQREIFTTIPGEEGYPDGPMVDAEGCIWTGLYAGWSVRRYSPKGELLETIRFPVANVTKVAFGGAGLTTMFATTAAQQLSPQERAQQPLAGDLFALEVDVPGLPGVEVSIGLNG